SRSLWPSRVVVDHPTDAELVPPAGVERGPTGTGQVHLDPTTGGERLEDAPGLLVTLDVEVDVEVGALPEVLLHVGGHVRAHEVKVGGDLEADVADAVTVLWVRLGLAQLGVAELVGEVSAEHGAVELE